MTRGRAEPVGVLQAHFPVTERLARMANSVDRSYREYRQLVFLREPLKSTFTFTLTVVLLLSLLAAIYGAFVLSRRLVAPIQDLVAGTRAVAAGDFDTRLQAPTRDEIGFLISSFNDMTQRLAAARREASLSQALVEAERANLEVILARLSTGVVALESDLRIRNANQASGMILGVDLENRAGEYLPDLAKGSPLLEQFVDVAQVHLGAGETEWREQIVLRGDVGRRRHRAQGRTQLQRHLAGRTECRRQRVRAARPHPEAARAPGGALYFPPCSADTGDGKRGDGHARLV